VAPAAQVLLQKIKIAKEVRAEMDKIQELKNKIEGMKKTQKAKNDHLLKESLSLVDQLKNHFSTIKIDQE
jgi:hypothetical protein